MWASQNQIRDNLANLDGMASDKGLCDRFDNLWFLSVCHFRFVDTRREGIKGLTCLNAEMMRAKFHRIVGQFCRLNRPENCSLDELPLSKIQIFVLLPRFSFHLSSLQTNHRRLNDASIHQINFYTSSSPHATESLAKQLPACSYRRSFFVVFHRNQPRM